MASPPFNPNEAVPGDNDVVSQFPAAEREFRDIIEDWINFEHDPSGHHKFQVIDTATRDGISDWVVGSVIFNTDNSRLEALTSTGPNVWSPAVATVISSGSWTPAISVGGSTTGITYSTQAGRYYRIGNMVTLWGNIVLTNDGFALSGDVLVTGIPFDAAPSPEISAHGVLVPTVNEESNTAHDTWCRINADGTSIVPMLKFYVDAEGIDLVDQWSNESISNNTGFSFQITYVTDAA